MSKDKDVDMFVRRGAVGCEPDGGDVTVEKGGKIKWKKQNVAGREEYRLSFNDRDSGQPAWPFDEPADPAGSNSSGWRSKHFKATVAVAAGAYKYTVEARGDGPAQPYDPVIIVKP